MCYWPWKRIMKIHYFQFSLKSYQKYLISIVSNYHLIQSEVFQIQLLTYNYISQMKNRGKQNKHNTNHQFIASTYKVQSDQKDLIIKALRNDQQNLKQNQAEYYKLNDNFKQLQHRYKLLNDQKVNDDKEFKMRHDAAVRNIGQIKYQIDSLKAETRDKKLEINDLETDSNSLKQLLDQKNIELQNFRNDYKSCLADSEQLGAERQSLNNASSKLKGIITQVQQQHKLLKQDNDSVEHRLYELQKYQQQLLIQQKILRDKILAFENENNGLDNNINELCDNLADLELEIKKAQDQLTNLQQAVNQINLLNEKYKTESQHIQKSIQAEILKNNNFIKALKNAQYTHKVRAGQLNEGERQIVSLKQEKQSLAQINSKLAEDLSACRAHLQNLGLINSKLVDHLQNFSSEDEATRQLITRKPRVQICRTRVTQSQNSTLYPSLTSENYSKTRIGSSHRQYR